MKPILGLCAGLVILYFVAGRIIPSVPQKSEYKSVTPHQAAQWEADVRAKATRPAPPQETQVHSFAAPALGPGETARAQPAYVHPTVSAAQGFLREQQAANQRTLALVARARDAGNFSQAVRALEARRREIHSAMQSVDSGIRSGYFHKDDRSTLLEPLEQELAWAEASLATLRPLE